MAKKIGAVLSGIALGVAAAVSPAIPASAAADDYFYVCGGQFETCGGGSTEGTIVWYNRTAGITGGVSDSGPGSTTAIFEAFAGSTKIESQTRTADDETSLGAYRGFNFTIGDSDLVGGIDRIKITVCFNYPDGPLDCSPNYNELKNS
ncbi:hypothetical protein [Micromonospora sagamiensis]|uniref:Uncharacterized protein n=1 Tax=Micromonospora sagamiensis TaxID=47875 RepID=A0A562WPB5_9ACTN|nr:hypothetical protein [Micromonospora sagamiensis]TWJ32055.1 hypothetical protein JD81_05625 [Micromonospora sagamiensis]BCL14888.1 hypothetical protein GCM10017556_26270 [Micromonospora sagamiensis]